MSNQMLDQYESTVYGVLDDGKTRSIKITFEGGIDVVAIVGLATNDAIHAFVELLKTGKHSVTYHERFERSEP